MMGSRKSWTPGTIFLGIPGEMKPSGISDNLGTRKLTHTSIPAFKINPAVHNTTRVLWTAGLILNAGILVWVSFLVPKLSEIPLGFISPGIPRNIVPGVQLFLLPIISILFFFTSWLTGVYFYRRSPSRTLAFLTWGFADFSSVLFVLAILFIITSPVSI